MVEVRAVRPEEEEMIYELIVELEKTEPDREAFHRVFRRNLEQDGIFYGAAVEDGRIVGFISLHIQELLHHAGRIGEIQELIVTGQVQGRGAGRRLVEWADVTAGEQGCFQIEVCCNLARPESHLFYERVGMKKSHFKFCKIL